MAEIDKWRHSRGKKKPEDFNGGSLVELNSLVCECQNCVK